DEMREERDEYREVEQAAPRPQLPAIDVDRIAHRLERVERDADGQDDPEDRQRRSEPCGLQNCLYVRREEVEVLEEAQHPEVRDDAQPEEPATPAGPLFHAARGAVIDRRRDGDQDEEPGMDVSVEDVARDEQEHVLAALRQQPVRRCYDDEEDDEVETM